MDLSSLLNLLDKTLTEDIAAKAEELGPIVAKPLEQFVDWSLAQQVKAINALKETGLTAVEASNYLASTIANATRSRS